MEYHTRPQLRGSMTHLTASYDSYYSINEYHAPHLRVRVPLTCPNPLPPHQNQPSIVHIMDGLLLPLPLDGLLLPLPLPWGSGAGCFLLQLLDSPVLVLYD